METKVGVQMEIKTPYGLILKKISGSLEGVKILEETLEVFMPEEYQDQVQITMPISGIIFLVVGKLIMKKTSALDAQILTANGLSGQLAAKRVDQGNRKDLFKFLQNKGVSNAQAQELKIATWKIAHVQVNLFQKLSFLNQLTHNVTTDCSLIPDFSAKKIQVQDMLCTKIVLNAKTKTKNQFLYTTCSEHVFFLY
jgi:hypothetical protein